MDYCGTFIRYVFNAKEPLNFMKFILIIKIVHVSDSSAAAPVHRFVQIKSLHMIAPFITEKAQPLVSASFLWADKIRTQILNKFNNLSVPGTART